MASRPVNVDLDLLTTGQVTGLRAPTAASEAATKLYVDNLIGDGLTAADIGVTVQAFSAVLDATTASFTTAKDTKLTGIEAGATADQTAAEILTALLTVDGAGSGLDADLLDGTSAAAFQLVSAKGQPDGYAQLDVSGLIPDALLPAGIARDAEVTSAVDTAINALLDGAPTALNTLNELAAAIGDDANYAASVTAALADKQPLNAGLTSISALTTTSYGRSVLTVADAAALRTLAGLGSIATQSAGAVAITGGTITGITDLAVADGGTGASDAATARSNLVAQKTIPYGATAPVAPSVGDLWLDTNTMPGDRWVCTSSTRPAAPYPGLEIFETDTLLGYIWSGSAWVETVRVGAWSTWTPTVLQASTGINLTSLVARYVKIGRTVIGQFSATINSGGVTGTITVSYPTSALTQGNQPMGMGSLYTGSNRPLLVLAASNMTFMSTEANSGYYQTALATGNVLQFSFTYEAAA